MVATERFYPCTSDVVCITDRSETRMYQGTDECYTKLAESTSLLLSSRTRLIDSPPALAHKNHIYINNHKQKTIQQAGPSSILHAIIFITFTIIICFQEHSIKIHHSISLVAIIKNKKKIVIHPIKLSKIQENYYKETFLKRHIIIMTIGRRVEEKYQTMQNYMYVLWFSRSDWLTILRYTYFL